MSLEVHNHMYFIQKERRNTSDILHLLMGKHLATAKQCLERVSMQTAQRF